MRFLIIGKADKKTQAGLPRVRRKMRAVSIPCSVGFKPASDAEQRKPRRRLMKAYATTRTLSDQPIANSAERASSSCLLEARNPSGVLQIT
jgi:hypothetical protein